MGSTQWFNRKYKRVGHLLQGRSKSPLLENMPQRASRREDLLFKKRRDRLTENRVSNLIADHAPERLRGVHNSEMVRRFLKFSRFRCCETRVGAR